MDRYHIPVMLHECIEGLHLQPQGIYVDVTFGGGGHSRAILEQLSGGQLFGFDQDADAERNAPDDPRFTFVRSNFRFLKNFLRYHGVPAVDGILADLGVSSHHLDAAERGFAFRFDAPLDMRMNQAASKTAKHVLNTYDEARLESLFRHFGELDNSRKLASVVVRRRQTQLFDRTTDFLEAIASCTPRLHEHKYYAKVFQALRMEVNDEMKALEQFLLQSQQVLRPGGRLVVMTYHSLEDRLVKNFLRSGNLQGTIEKDLYGRFETPWTLINRKVIEASEQEIEQNNRARSAKLRIAQKN